jgi:bacillithiol synthase
VSSECLPFSALPHQTRLFLDYVGHFDRVSSFYPHPPFQAGWLPQQAQALRYDAERRAGVADALERQNRAWGAAGKTLDAIARFRAGAAAVVTGQQVGLFGGPLFSLYKALTALRYAAEFTRLGQECVPIFWLATEDHDLAEVNHATLLTPEFSLQTLASESQGTAGAPVGTVAFGEEIGSQVEAAARLLGPGEAADMLRASYAPGQTFGSAFARLFTQMFRDFGVILLDASDPALHRLAEPVYRAAILGAAEVRDGLLERGRALTAAGYHEQVKVMPSSTLLFTLQDGARVPIHWAANGNGRFTIGEEKVSPGELAERIQRRPQEFTPNVLLRPVVQDHLLPTLAYIGGPAEVAYFAQAAVVYRELLGRTTPILPRFSATLVEPRMQRLLERYGLTVADALAGPDELRKTLAGHHLPQRLQATMEEAASGLDRSLDQVTAELLRLDPTLVDAARRAGSKMRYQLQRLRARAAAAELRRSHELGQHAEQLSTALYPRKQLQEREIAGISLLGSHGPGLLQDLYRAMQAGCPDHQVLYL